MWYLADQWWLISTSLLNKRTIRMGLFCTDWCCFYYFIRNSVDFAGSSICSEKRCEILLPPPLLWLFLSCLISCSEAVLVCVGRLFCFYLSLSWNASAWLLSVLSVLTLGLYPLSKGSHGHCFDNFNHLCFLSLPSAFRSNKLDYDDDGVNERGCQGQTVTQAFVIALVSRASCSR